MKLQLRHFYCLAAALMGFLSFGQDISLLKQYNGRYDFTFIGNTLNLSENTGAQPDDPECTILTASSAQLNLNAGDIVQNAYLYWAGSGDGDFNVKLNGTEINAQRIFHITSITNDALYFSAFAEVTELVKATGNGNYLFSDLDLLTVIPGYCPFGGNFGGWAIVIVYKNNNLPLTQVNVYDGMQAVPAEINITLNNLNVIDDQNSKIAFLAWEGDRGLADNESLLINDQEMGVGDEFNPADNVFNGTNSFTAREDLFNMDMDVYDLQGYVHVGNTSARIKLTSDADFVMINTIVTRLNSRLPDPTIVIDNIALECDSRTINIDFSVLNVNGTNPVPAGVPVSVYADNLLVTVLHTNSVIPAEGIGTYSAEIVLPNAVPNDFSLHLAVNSSPDNAGVVTEIDPDNNDSEPMPVSLWHSPMFTVPGDLEACYRVPGNAEFDLSGYEETVKINPEDHVSFFGSIEDAEAGINAIPLSSPYIAVTTPQRIYARIENEHCFSVTPFNLITKKCPPKVYNLVDTHPNNFYDTLIIEGLRDIFQNFVLSIYNRWGELVWTGTNNTEDWNGRANKGGGLLGKALPEGTYFYILELNEPGFPEPLNGFLYLKD